MLAELRLPALDGLVASRVEGALYILFVYVVVVLAAATSVVVAITVLCVRRCRRTGRVGARILSAAWGLVLVGAVAYAWGRMTDMTLDPAEGDFWWSAWMTVGGLGNALAAWTGAVIGGVKRGSRG